MATKKDKKAEEDRIATAFFMLFEDMNNAIFNLMKNWLISLKKYDDLTASYLNDLEMFSLKRKNSLLKSQENNNLKGIISFDLVAASKQSYSLLPKEISLLEKKEIIFFLDEHQKKLLSNRLREFSKSLDGIGKMLMAYPHIHHLFRKHDYR